MVALLIALLAGGAYATYRYLSGTQPERGGQRAAPTVTTSQATRERWVRQRSAIGTLTAIQGTELTAEMPGKVSAIEFESGQRVEAGTTLVRLDTSSEQAQLKSLKPQLRQATSDLKRAQELRSGNAISEEAFEEAVTAVERLRAEIARQRAIIEQKQIVAPFTGELGLRQVSLGQYVQPGTPVVSLQQLEPIDVDFDLPEQQAREVAPGQTIRLSVDAYPDASFEGEIIAINPQIERSTRSFTARGRLPNGQRRLRPGMFADVTVQLPGQREVVTVPATAVAFNAYGESLYVVEAAGVEEKSDDAAEQSPGTAADAESPSTAKADAESKSTSRPSSSGTDQAAPDAASDTGGQQAASAGGFVARRTFVRTGERRGLKIEIRSGVQAGTRVVTAGQLKLGDRTPVRLSDEEVTSTAAPRPSQP